MENAEKMENSILIIKDTTGTKVTLLIYLYIYIFM